MIRTVRTDFAAVNGKGVTLYTFNDLQSARAWARDNAARHDGLRIEQVTLVAATVYTPRRSRPAPDFRIPVYEARA